MKESAGIISQAKFVTLVLQLICVAVIHETKVSLTSPESYETDISLVGSARHIRDRVRP